MMENKMAAQKVAQLVDSRVAMMADLMVSLLDEMTGD
jgi:hypothetical protein